MNEEQIKRFIEESPYGPTIKEWNFIKKSVRAMIPEDASCEFRKDGKWLDVEIRLPRRFIDIPRTLHEAMSRRDFRYPGIRFNEQAGEIKKAAQSIVDRHQVCYSERDIQTDYFGLYRLSCVAQIRAEEGASQDMGAIAGEIFRRNEQRGDSQNSFRYDDFNELAEKHGFPCI